MIGGNHWLLAEKGMHLWGTLLNLFTCNVCADYPELNGADDYHMRFAANGENRFATQVLFHRRQVSVFTCSVKNCNTPAFDLPISNDQHADDGKQ